MVRDVVFEVSLFVFVPGTADIIVVLRGFCGTDT
jgi:hypothetical protein